MIEVHERKRLVRQYHRRATVNGFMDQHFPVTQSIVKLLDVIRRAQCEVVIRQPNTRPLVAFFQRAKQLRDVESQTNIEIRLIELSIKFKHLASWPGF